MNAAHAAPRTVHQFISEVRQDNAASGPHRLDTYRSASLRPLTPEALKDFIAIEHPSCYIDGAYSRVIATLDQGRAQRYPEHMVDLAVRIAGDGVQHETRFRQIKDALVAVLPATLSYLRKNFREGNKIEAKGAIKPLRTIKDNLRSAYIAAAGNQFGRTRRESRRQPAEAMIQLLEVGEELAAKRHIGIPFFKIWNELPVSRAASFARHSPHPRLMPSAPSDFHLFHTDDGPHLLLVDGSQIFKIDEELGTAACGRASRAGNRPRDRCWPEHGLGLRDSSAMSRSSIRRCARCRSRWPSAAISAAPIAMPKAAASAARRETCRGRSRRPRFGVCSPRRARASGSTWPFWAANRWSIAT